MAMPGSWMAVSGIVVGEGADFWALTTIWKFDHFYVIYSYFLQEFVINHKGDCLHIKLRIAVAIMAGLDKSSATLTNLRCKASNNSFKSRPVQYKFLGLLCYLAQLSGLNSTR